MSTNQVDDSFGLLSRQSQSITNLLGDGCTQFIVAMKTNPILGIFEGARLAHIVKQGAHRQGEGRLREVRQDQAGVNEDIPFGMKLRWLHHIPHLLDLWQDALHQSTVGEELISSEPMGGNEDSFQFIANSFATDIIDEFGFIYHRLPGVRLDGELEDGGETDRSHHPQSIFLKSLSRLTDRTDDFQLQIFATTDMIHDLLGIDVPEHSIDGEISPQRIFLLVGESNRLWSAAIGDPDVCAEGGDLHLSFRFDDPNHSELGPDQHRLLEQSIDDFRDRRGGEIEIFRWKTQQVITDRSTSQQAAVARFDEAPMDPQHVIGDLRGCGRLGVRG